MRIDTWLLGLRGMFGSATPGKRRISTSMMRWLRSSLRIRSVHLEILFRIPFASNFAEQFLSHYSIKVCHLGAGMGIPQQLLSWFSRSSQLSQI